MNLSKWPRFYNIAPQWRNFAKSGHTEEKGKRSRSAVSTWPEAIQRAAAATRFFYFKVSREREKKFFYYFDPTFNKRRRRTLPKILFEKSHFIVLTKASIATSEVVGISDKVVPSDALPRANPCLFLFLFYFSTRNLSAKFTLNNIFPASKKYCTANVHCKVHSVWAVVVGQLAEGLLPIPEVRGLNPINEHIYR